LRAPQRQDFPQLKDLANHRWGGGVGTLLGPMGAIGEAIGPERAIPSEPLVTRLPADAIAPAELGEGTGGRLGIQNEPLTLIHG
jgi:hypothetical protein